MTIDQLLSFFTTIGAPPEMTRRIKEFDMGWLTILLSFLPMLLDLLKALLNQEREAAKQGIDSPIMAAIKVFETTGDSKPFYAAAEAAMATERRLAEPVK